MTPSRGHAGGQPEETEGLTLPVGWAGVGRSGSQDMEQTGSCEFWGVLGPPRGTTSSQEFSAHHPSDPWPGVTGPILVVHERLGDTQRRKPPWDLCQCRADLGQGTSSDLLKATRSVAGLGQVVLRHWWLSRAHGGRGVRGSTRAQTNPGGR